MAGSSIIVAVNAVALKRLRLPERRGGGEEQAPPAAGMGGEREPAPGAA